MKIVIAPQSFKGSLSAYEAAAAMNAGVLAAGPDIETAMLPLADGGSGTVRALLEAAGGRSVTTAVHGPLDDMVDADWGILGDGVTAVIEMSAASGLTLVPEEKRNALRASTRGTGELIRAALDAGCKHIIVGLGDSATTDGGAGMARALGIRLLDRSGKSVPPGGEGLLSLERIDLSQRHPLIGKIGVSAACDVDNPLYGPQGAAFVYGPQKGATPAMIEVLDSALRHYADIILHDTGKDVSRLPGAGAAGGLGAGLVAFLNASLRSGVDIVCDALDIEKHLRNADLVLAGEGRIDFQTVCGKTAAGIARRAGAHNVPVIALCGELGEGFEKMYELGVRSVTGIVPPGMDKPRAMQQAARLLREAAEKAARQFLAGRES